MATRLLSLCLLFGMQHTLAAQNLTFMPLGTGSDDFPTQRITALTTDQDGLLWFGTQEGLYRYDGQLARPYRFDPTDSTSISSNFVTALFEDHAGYLWVGTYNGLNRMNRYTGTFERNMLEGPGEEPPIVWAIQEAADQSLWFGSKIGLYTLDAAHNVSRHVTTDFPTDTPINALQFDTEGTLWISALESGVYRYTLSTNKAVVTSAPTDVRALHLDAAGTLWMGSRGQGLWHVSQPGGQPQPVQFANTLPREPNQIEGLTHDAFGYLWAATTTGLLQYDMNVGTAQLHQEVTGNQRRNQVMHVYSTPDDLLWIATRRGGLELGNLRARRFPFQTTYLNQSDTPMGRRVRTALEAPDGTIWTGTNQGVFAIQPGQPLRHYLEGVIANTLHLEAHTGLWVGTRADGLYLLDPATGRILEQHRATEDNTGLSGNTIHAIHPARHGGLWLGTGTGLHHYNVATQRFTRYPEGPAPGGLSANIVMTLAESENGMLWIGLLNGGLNRLNIATGATRHFRHDPGDLQSLSDDFVTDIELSPDGTVWVATANGGFNALAASTDTFRRFELPAAVDGNGIARMMQDPVGNLWMSAGSKDALLVRFTPETEAAVTYRASEGIRFGVPWIGAGWMNPDTGTLLFGGRNGFTRFSTQQMPQPPKPRMLFTRFTKQNHEVLHLFHPGDTLHVDPGEVTFSLRFSVLDYLNPKARTHSYFRRGLDEDWVTVNNDDPEIMYTNLGNNGGTYTLLTRGTNGNAIAHEAALTIEVEPPRWKRMMPWLLLLFGGIMAQGIYAGTRYMERRKLRDAERRLALVEEQAALDRRSSEIARQESALATQKLHAEQLRRKQQETQFRAVREYFDRVSTEIAYSIHQNPVNKLEYLHSELDLVAAESGNGELQSLYGDLLPDVCGALRDICSYLILPDFAQYRLDDVLRAYVLNLQKRAPNLNFDFVFDLHEEPLPQHIAGDLYRIYQILVDNIAEHAQATRAHISCTADDASVVLVVADNGKGFSGPTDVNELKATQHYGLYLAHFFAAAAQGTLSIKTQPNAGTTIQLTIPLGPNQNVS